MTHRCPVHNVRFVESAHTFGSYCPRCAAAVAGGRDA